MQLLGAAHSPGDGSWIGARLGQVVSKLLHVQCLVCDGRRDKICLDYDLHVLQRQLLYLRWQA